MESIKYLKIIIKIASVEGMIFFISDISNEFQHTIIIGLKIMQVGHPESRDGLATVQGWNQVISVDLL